MFCIYFSNTDPEPNPPFFNSYTLKATMDYLTKCHTTSGQSHTLVSLLAKTQVGDDVASVIVWFV